MLIVEWVLGIDVDYVMGLYGNVNYVMIVAENADCEISLDESVNFEISRSATI